MVAFSTGVQIMESRVQVCGRTGRRKNLCSYQVGGIRNKALCLSFNFRFFCVSTSYLNGKNTLAP